MGLACVLSNRAHTLTLFYRTTLSSINKYFNLFSFFYTRKLQLQILSKKYVVACFFYDCCNHNFKLLGVVWFLEKRYGENNFVKKYFFTRNLFFFQLSLYSVLRSSSFDEINFFFQTSIFIFLIF